MVVAEVEDMEEEADMLERIMALIILKHAVVAEVEEDMDQMVVMGILVGRNMVLVEVEEDIAMMVQMLYSVEIMVVAEVEEDMDLLVMDMEVHVPIVVILPMQIIQLQKARVAFVSFNTIRNVLNKKKKSMGEIPCFFYFPI